MKNIIVLFLLFFVISIAMQCKNDVTKPKDTFRVYGKIVDYKGGSLSNAKVILDNASKWTTYTSADGEFEIKEVSKGQHQLVAEYSYADTCYIKRIDQIVVTADLSLSELKLPNPVYLDPAQITQGLNTNYIKLSWTKSLTEDFREYKIYRHTSSGLDESTGTLIHIATSATDTTFTDSIPHSSTFFYRVFVLNEYGHLGGSNILKVQTSTYQTNLELTTSVPTQGYLNPGDKLWFYFSASKGEIYKITWSEDKFYITGYREDKTTSYFSRERIIQMDGSPKTIIAEDNEKVYLLLEGYDETTSGLFEMRVDLLDKNNAVKIVTGNQQAISISKGESKLYYFDSVMDYNYVISLETSYGGAAYDDEISTKVSAYRENMNYAYFYEEFPGLNGSANVKNILALGTERVYLIVTGAYWWNPTNVYINIVCNRANYFPIQVSNFWEYKVSTSAGDAFGVRFAGVEKWEVKEIINDSTFLFDCINNGRLISWGLTQRDTTDVTNDSSTMRITVRNSTLGKEECLECSIDLPELNGLLNEYYVKNKIKVLYNNYEGDTIKLNIPIDLAPPAHFNYIIVNNVGIINIDYFETWGTVWTSYKYELLNFRVN